MAEQKRQADEKRLAAYLKHSKGSSAATGEGHPYKDGTGHTRGTTGQDNNKEAGRPGPDKDVHGSDTIGKPGLVKTVAAEGQGRARSVSGLPPAAKESKYRKVAKLLIVIGQKEASKILSKLEPEQIEAITKEIALIKTVTREEGEAILAEFRSLFSEALRYRGTLGPERGGVDVARELLHTAFGKEKGETLLRQAVPEAIENPFQFLEDFTGEQISFLLKEETTPVLALVLSRLSPQKSAECIKQLPANRRLEVVKRLAKMGKTSPEVLEKVAEVLRERAHKIGKTETTEVDGKAALAAILRYADPSLGDEILENLEEVNPDLSREIKEKLYTLDDVIRCEDRALQEKLRTMTDRDIALLLKGQKPEFIDKIKSNLSANRRTLIEEERDLLGPVPRKETEAVVQDFLSWFRLGRENGTILLADDQDVL
jgi:flagellar motor switch protein FliG